MSVQLTQQYVALFNAKDIDGIAKLLTNDFILEDPVVKRIQGKQDALAAILNIFNSCTQLSFIAKNIYQDQMTTIIEFVLTLDHQVLTGTDIIDWDEMGQMIELRAYLDIPK